MAAVQIYPLEQFRQLIFTGFDYKLEDHVLDNISNLARQVGSPDYIKTPIFKKREIEKPKPKHKKHKETKNEEEDDFQTTKIETKTGIHADFDAIRSHINKLTDKNYPDMLNKIIDIIQHIVGDTAELHTIGTNIFEIASSNRYYSKIYADLYAKLYSDFDFIRAHYESNITKFTGLFETIVYVDPNDNYDRFCENNKSNERRKSLASFYMNLMNHGVVPKEMILQITQQLLERVVEYTSLENKKNEVDEMTDILSILFKKDLYKNNPWIPSEIRKLANCKVKECKSFTTKALFVYMDLSDLL